MYDASFLVGLQEHNQQSMIVRDAHFRKPQAEVSLGSLSGFVNRVKFFVATKFGSRIVFVSFNELQNLRNSIAFFQISSHV